jgi:trans-aconitate methyltransferase
MVIFEDLLLVFFILVLLFLIAQFYNIMFRGYAPFISTRYKVLKRIVNELNVGSNGTIYELGCGDAGFLRLARRKFPEAKLVGVEYSLLPYIIAQVQSSLSKSKIKFLKKNIFRVDLKEADVIYCFLNIKTMVLLEKKLEQECRPGTTLVSYHFTLPNRKPEKVIEMGNLERIYFYKL